MSEEHFYPRSPCGERRDLKYKCDQTILFLSTLSLRRATKVAVVVPSGSLYFYPRSPCGERHGRVNLLRFKRVISIHALLAESDIQWEGMKSLSEVEFLSTLSLRRATFSAGREYDTEGYFYPRSPCGERHGRVNLLRFKRVISIHALLAESDIQWEGMKSLSEVEFLSTLSLRRATFSAGREYDTEGYFYPRSPCGERPRAANCQHRSHHFYPRSPCGERLPATR